MKKEYGGYLPLELHQGQEWFQCAEVDIRRYNCGRTAIYEAALSMSSEVKKIYAPYYICHTVIQAIEQAGIEVKRYYTNEKLEPIFDFEVNNECEGVLVVNYFGLKDNFMQKVAKRYAHMILDCTQAFFFRPVMQEGVSNVYSCRKFIGVPDGAYLIGKNTNARWLAPGNSWMRYGFLCKAHELGTNAAYQDSLESERQLGKCREGMSPLTQRVLRGIDYNLMIEKRKANFETMQEFLGKINRLLIVEEHDGIPQCYPFWVPEGMGQMLKEMLLKEHIYIPTLWKECHGLCKIESQEIAWTNDLLCLPIDQRYEEADMEFLSKTVIKCLGEIRK